MSAASVVANSQSLINVNPGDMFTGPVAMHMIGAPGGGITLPTAVGEKWRVFVQSRHYGVRHIPRHTTVLYKVSIHGRLKHAFL